MILKVLLSPQGLHRDRKPFTDPEGRKEPSDGWCGKPFGVQADALGNRKRAVHMVALTDNNDRVAEAVFGKKRFGEFKVLERGGRTILQNDSILGNASLEQDPLHRFRFGDPLVGTLPAGDDHTDRRVFEQVIRGGLDPTHQRETRLIAVDPTAENDHCCGLFRLSGSGGRHHDGEHPAPYEAKTEEYGDRNDHDLTTALLHPDGKKAGNFRGEEDDNGKKNKGEHPEGVTEIQDTCGGQRLKKDPKAIDRKEQKDQAKQIATGEYFHGWDSLIF